jgi:hypothetical protein
VTRVLSNSRKAASVGLLLGVSLSLFATVPAQAAVSAGEASHYGVAAVSKAFTQRGIKLYNASFGTSSPVASLASVKAHDGWRVGIYVYPDLASAKSAFNQNVAAWLRAGMATRLVKNVVVVVVPVGRVLAKKAKHYPMPTLVSQAIAAFAR